MVRTTRPPSTTSTSCRSSSTSTRGRRPAARRRPRGGGERGLRLRPDDAVAAEPGPLLEGDDGEPRLLAGHAVDRLGRQVAEVGELLLQRADGDGRVGSSSAGGFGRRHDGPAQRRGRDRLRRVDAREEPERRAAEDAQPHRLHAAEAGRRQHELRHARAQVGGLVGLGEGLVEVDDDDAAGLGDAAHDGLRGT